MIYHVCSLMFSNGNVEESANNEIVMHASAYTSTSTGLWKKNSKISLINIGKFETRGHEFCIRTCQDSGGFILVCRAQRKCRSDC
jgi:hypothetical protein